MESTVGTIDLKELKQRLQVKKEERVVRVIGLGEVVYKSVLADKFQELSIVEEVQAILQVDKEIYKVSTKIVKESNNLENCPSCQQQNASNVKFCGNCGTLNPLFVDQQIEKTSCNTCEELIPADYAYCPCCGMKQEDN